MRLPLPDMKHTAWRIACFRRRMAGSTAVGWLCLLLTMSVVCYVRPFGRIAAPTDWQRQPPLATVEREAIRLNEFLAHKQYECKNSTEPVQGTFHLCHDVAVGAKPFSPLRYFSTLYSFDNGAFDSAMIRRSAMSWIVTATDAELNLDSPNSFFKVRRITSTEFQNAHIMAQIPPDFAPNIIKLDALHQSDLPTMPDLVIRTLSNVRLETGDTILLNMRLPAANEPEIQRVLYAWYSVLNHIFHSLDLVLYAAAMSGQCGREIRQCVYMLSFVRRPPAGDLRVVAPVAGLGSPEEEARRLLDFFSQRPQADAPFRCHDDRQKFPSPLLCTSQLARSNEVGGCLAYIFQHGRDNIASQLTGVLSSISCETHLFNPDFSSESLQSLREKTDAGILRHGVGMASSSHDATVPAAQSATEWHLSPLQQLMTRLNHSRADILALDLNGGEWDVMEGLLQSRVLLRFNQIVARIRIWFGEENENYRDQYSWMLRLRRDGFVLSRIYPISTGGAECPLGSCFDIVWLRN